MTKDQDMLQTEDQEALVVVTDSNFAHGKHPVCLDKSA